MKNLNAALFVLLLNAAAFSADAESLLPWETQPLIVEDRLRVEAGAFSGAIETSARVDFSPDFPGTEFSAEDDFGLPANRTLFLPELTLLPGKRHLLRISGFSLQRTGRKVIERDIDFDEDLFETGDTVDSQLDLNVLKAVYGYRLVRRERFELDAVLGVALADLAVNAEVRSIATREPSGELTPIPVAGLEMRANLFRKLAIELRGHYVSVTVDTLTGSITDLRGALTWNLNPHLIAGLGYQSFDLQAESGEEDSSGFVRLNLSGPVLFFRASL